MPSLSGVESGDVERAGVDRTRVVAAVIRRGGRVLLCRRPRHKRHGGLWEFPGGKVREGESLLDAARRELREELEVEVRGAAPEPAARIADPGAPFLIAFLPVEIEGEPRPIEHPEISWIAPADLPGYPLAPADGAFARDHLSRRRAP